MGDVAVWWNGSPLHGGLSQHTCKVGGGERVVDELDLVCGVRSDVVDVVLDGDVTILHEEIVCYHLRGEKFRLRFKIGSKCTDDERREQDQKLHLEVFSDTTTDTPFQVLISVTICSLIFFICPH